MKLIRNRQMAFILQACILCILYLLPVSSLSLEALSFAELNDPQRAQECEDLLLQMSVDQSSELDQTEIQAIRSIKAARKMKKQIQRRGMRPSQELHDATLALQKVVDSSTDARSSLLQLDEKLQLDTDGQDSQPIIELVVSDFGGPPPHKRLHRTDGKHKKHHHHHKNDDESSQDSSGQEKSQEEGDQGVESKQFDSDDLEAYTSNAINNQFNDVKRRGIGKHQEMDKKSSIDLAASLNNIPKPQQKQILTQAQKKVESEEDSVERAFSEPAVQQETTVPVEKSVASSTVEQKTSNEADKPSQEIEKQNISDEQTPKPPIQIKEPIHAAMETKRLDAQAKEFEQETYIPKKAMDDDANEEINAYSQYLNSGSDQISKKEPLAKNTDSQPTAKDLYPNDQRMSLTQSVDQEQRRAVTIPEITNPTEKRVEQKQEDSNAQSLSQVHRRTQSQYSSEDLDDLDEHYSFEALLQLNQKDEFIR